MSFKTREGVTVNDVVTLRKRLLAQYEAEFARLFGLSLRTYFTPGRGFSTNEFAWRIGGDAKPWRDIVQEKAGAEGMALVELLQADGRTPHSTSARRPTKQARQPVAVNWTDKAHANPAGDFAKLFADEGTGDDAEAGEDEAPEASADNGIASLFAD